MTGLLRALLLCAAIGCSDHAPTQRKLYVVGILHLGFKTYEIRADSSNYARRDTIRVEALQRVDEVRGIRNRLGIPQHWIVTQGRRRWKFSAEDFYLPPPLTPIEVGHVYVIDYGYRDVWYAANSIWSVQNVEEITIIHP